MEVTLNDKRVKGYIDTGATVTLISDEIVEDKLKHLKRYEHSVLDASGNLIHILGWLDVQITTPEGKFTEQMVVFKKHSNRQIDVLLGLNILEMANIYLPTKELVFSKQHMQNSKKS